MLIIQKIFVKHGQQYLETFRQKMPANHKKTLLAIMNCRTASMGGQTYYCEHCKTYHYSYHSCQNRHCVICQNNDAEKWLQEQLKLLLPFPYFLATFTIPQAFRTLARKNQKIIYNILFKAAADALKLLANDTKYLGAQIGMIGILHTWTRTLIYHPHVHFLIPGGGLSVDGHSVRFAQENFLMHVKPLSIIFRAKFKEQLKKKSPELFSLIPQSVWKTPWVVHIKSVGDGRKALLYMARYVFRVAISDARIIKLQNGLVTFKYTDSKTAQIKYVTLNAQEFIRRFLQHVLPHNFMKVRYFGIFAPTNRQKLRQLRKLLFLDETPEVKSAKNKVHFPDHDPSRLATGQVICPLCGNKMIWINTFKKGEYARAP